MQSLQSLLISDQYFRWKKVAYLKLCKGTQVNNTEFFLWKKRQLRGDARTAQKPWVPWRGGLIFTLLSNARGHQMKLREARCKSKSCFSTLSCFLSPGCCVQKNKQMEVLLINSECNKMDLTVSRIQKEFDSMAVKLCAGKWRMWKNGVFFSTEKTLGIMPGNPVNKGTWEKLFLPMPHCQASKWQIV